MNSTYSCFENGKVLVTNENGKQIYIDNYDNIDEILAEENVIESIGKKMNELQDMQKKYEKINKRKFIPIMIIISFIISKFVLPIIFNSFELIIYNSFLSSNLINVLLLSFAVVGDTALFLKHKQNIKKQKGINSELFYLEHCLKKENSKMKKLLRNSKHQKSSKTSININVRSSDKIDDINRYLDFYYNIGYNSDRYYNYYINDNVSRIIKKKYTEEDLDLVRDYFENQSNSHVKKKVKKL